MGSTKECRPSRLGAFDEETCRFILQELGECVVPYFPFFYGIEQVYKCLLDRYGEKHIADAMSVLHELLEDDSLAIGVGDEGDSWRSWRYDWRHRNDNPLNPSTPGVGDYLFPPPTPRRVRLIKSANFLAMQGLTEMNDSGRHPVQQQSLQVQQVWQSQRGLGINTEAYQLLEEISKRKHSPVSPVLRVPTPGAHIKSHSHVPENLGMEHKDDVSACPSARKGCYTQPCMSTEPAMSASRTDSPRASAPTVCFGDHPDEDQSQQFVELDLRQSFTHPMDPLTVSSVMMHPRQAMRPLGFRLRGGDLDVRTYRPIANTSTRLDVSSLQEIQNNLVNFDSSVLQRANGDAEAHEVFPCDVCLNQPVIMVPESAPDDGMKSMIPPSPLFGSTSTNIKSAPYWAFDEQGPPQIHGLESSETMAEDLRAMAPDFADVDEICEAEWYPGVDVVTRNVSRPESRMTTASWKTRYSQDHNRLISGIGELVVSPGCALSLFGRRQTRRKGGTFTRSTFPRRRHPSPDGSPVVNKRDSPDYYLICETKQRKNDPSFSARLSSFLRRNNELGESVLSYSLPDKLTLTSTYKHSTTNDHLRNCLMHKNIHSMEVTSDPTLSAYISLDGTHDDEDQAISKQLNSPGKLTLDLNKALPPNPIFILPELSQSDRQTSQLQQFSGPSSAASTATSTVSRQSTNSGKTQFRHMARELIHRPDFASPHEPSPFQNVVHNQENTPNAASQFQNARSPEFVSSKMFNRTQSALQDRSLPPAEANGHECQHSVLSERAWNIEPERARKVVGTPVQHRHIPHALSENNIQYISAKNDTEPAQYWIPSYLRDRIQEESDITVESVSPTRGRTPASMRPATAQLADFEEEHEDILEHPKSARKGSRSPHKKLIGDNGWLTRSQSVREVTKEEKQEKSESPKKGALKQWGDKMKRKIGDLTTAESGQPVLSRSTFAISLNPPAQAKIYGELELMLCVSGNKFLMEQYEKGRMSPDSVARVTAGWRAKNRPQVREFQYDQLTQRDLVLANVKTFEFHGDAARNPVALNGILHCWKTLAKEMSIRTFCAADTQIKKHLLDARRVLEMFGAPLITFLAFQEIQSTAHRGIRNYQVRKSKRERRDTFSRSESDTMLSIGDESFEKTELSN